MAIDLMRFGSGGELQVLRLTCNCSPEYALMTDIAEEDCNRAIDGYLCRKVPAADIQFVSSSIESELCHLLTPAQYQRIERCRNLN